MIFRNRNLTGSGLSSVVMQQGQRGFIKSIQRGSIVIASGNTSNTATITAVVLANSRVRWLGNHDTGADTTEKGLTRAELTNTTTVTAYVAVAPSANLTVGYEVTEYFSGVLKSVQRGTIAVGAGTGSNTATITAVTTAKAELTFLGATVSVSQRDNPWITLTSSTVVTATNDVGAGGIGTAGYEVAEFF